MGYNTQTRNLLKSQGEAQVGEVFIVENSTDKCIISGRDGRCEVSHLQM